MEAGKLEIRSLGFAYGKKLVLRECTLSVRTGEVVAVLGPSGCGKTTLLRMIAGELAPDTGQVMLNGNDMLRLAIESRHVGYIMDAWVLYPHRTVKGNIEYPLRLRKLSRGVMADRVSAIAEQLDISDLLDRKPHELSAGQQQRVAIARCLVRDDIQVLLADEPFSSLDPVLRRPLRERLITLCRDRGIATVIVSHDQDDAALADRVAIMQSGTIVQEGTVEELYTTPISAFVAKFVGPVPCNLIPASSFPLRHAPDRAIAGFRPEHTIVAPPGASGTEGEVVGVERRPPQRWIKIVFGSDSILADDPSGRWTVGDRVSWSVSDEHVSVFKGDDGTRIEGRPLHAE